MAADLIFSDLNAVDVDVVSVVRTNVDPTATTVLLTGNGLTRWHVSQMPSGGDLLIMPSNQSFNGSALRRVHTLPVAGGSTTSYFDPATDGLSGVTVRGGRIDSASRLVLVYPSLSSTGIDVRRYSADLSTQENWTITKPSADHQRIDYVSVGPAGDKVAVIWRKTISGNEILFNEYTLDDGGTTYSTVTHLTGGDGIEWGSSAFSFALATGYHTDGGALYAYGEETIVGPDGLGRYSHPVDIHVQKFGGTGGSFDRVVFSADANPALFGSGYISPPFGLGGWLHGEDVSGSTVWGWMFFSAHTNPPESASDHCVTLMESGSASASFHLWADDHNADWVPLWTLVDDGISGDTRRRSSFAFWIYSLVGTTLAGIAALRACTG